MVHQSEFSVLPENDQLRQVLRDLRFVPAANPHPEHLTQEQIQQFNKLGYLKGFRVFTTEEMADIRGYFDQLLAKVIAEGGDSYSISTAHRKYGRVWDILTHERITCLVNDLLGPNVIGWGSHFFCKMPHDGKSVAWHQDASYWPLTPSKTATVWLAIDDADVENACMQFLPGSHLHGAIDYRESDQEEGNILNQTVEGVEKFGKPVNVELKAGEISIHSDMLLHGSEANESDRRRCGLTLRYCSAHVRAHLNWNDKGVYVCGTDDSGHWANQPRPAID
ncbi:Phytanoyl-CoA dioxygenase (PhyH) [Polystyrenella longa]|uniref:Phytanoyl-CoA dioxygenase (PhyH) n=1 Tax=Polystyrenella longa TaxID=2528007 RepID=A0A518CIJ3_9PLAN|nr:phytanoyl-CoA dioxygenase family protein [Polystyrenella longa]QDU79041.1 Phytanoyl-CoA dioxygenase (PhyH) [Polystyrenella longa]